MMSPLLALVLGTAWAAGPLDGTWTLDPKASESLGPLLEAQGASWAVRKAADAFVPVLRISQDGQTVTTTSKTPKGSTTEVFPTDGAPHATASPDGTQATWTTQWKGDTLVSSRRVVLGAEETAATLTLERKKVGDRLHQQVTLTIDGKTRASVQRVFVGSAEK